MFFLETNGFFDQSFADKNTLVSITFYLGMVGSRGLRGAPIILSWLYKSPSVRMASK